MIREENRDFYKGGLALSGLTTGQDSRIFDLWEDIFPFNHTNGKAPLDERAPNPQLYVKNMMQEKHAYIVGYLEGSVKADATNEDKAGTLTVKVNTADAVTGRADHETLSSSEEILSKTIVQPFYAGQKVFRIDLSDLAGLKKYVQLNVGGASMASSDLKLISWIEYQRQ